MSGIQVNVMKFFLFALVLYLGRVAFSCHKNVVPPSRLSDSSLTIKLKNCVNKNFGSETVTICLDSVLQDSRCPLNAVCIWQGIAIAKFSFIKNSSAYPVTLATFQFGNYSTDTILSGYKIKFINLSPYPGTFTPPAPANQINAEVQITRQ